MRLVSNLIRRFILGVVDDSPAVQEVQTQHGADRTSDGVEMLYPYGYRAVPPAGGEGVQVSVAGQTSNAVAIAVVDRANAPPTGSPGGACGMYLPGTYMVYVDPAGVVVLVGDSDSGRDATDAVPVDSKVQTELARIKAELDAVKTDLNTLKSAISGASATAGDGGAALKLAIMGALSTFPAMSPASPDPTASTKVKIPPT